ncbi:MAG: hypothetical protein IT379_12970 [Deltaproteobacteria bacterium]|nr:hypothetical protein [Deltaproteobacteria bacterium]
MGADRVGRIAGLMLSLLAACESAALREIDAGPDSRTQLETGAPDAGEDGGAPRDLGAADLSVPPTDAGAGDAGDAIAADGSGPRRPPRPPLPTAPAAEPRMIGDWLADVTPDSIEAASPIDAVARPPVFADCGSWTRTTSDGAETCEPWPAGGHATCMGATEHFPGGPGCERIGTVCPPAGSWDPAIAAVGGPVVRVRAGAPAGGDGSTGAPFATLAAALAAAPAGAVIALAEGTYEGGAMLGAGQSVWGACAERTFVDGPAAGRTFATSGLDASVRNVTVRPADRGFSASAGQSFILDDVVITGGTLVFDVAGGSISGTDVVVRDTRGMGAMVIQDGALSLTHAVLRGTSGDAIHLDGETEWRPATRATLSQVAILDVGGAGVESHDGVESLGAQLTMNGVVIERAPVGSGVFSRSGSIHATQVVIRDVAYFGFQILYGGDSTLGSALVERTGWAGFSLNTPTTASDLVARDTLTGIAAWVARVDIDGARVERAHGMGLHVWDGAVVTARSIDVRDVGRATSGNTTYAVGVGVTDRAVLTLEQSRIDGAAGAGLAIGGCIYGDCFGDTGRMGAATMATVTDLAVSNVRPSPDGTLPGYGVLVTGGAAGLVERVVVDGTYDTAIAVGYAGVGLPVTLASGSLAVADFVGRGSDASIGGILATDGADVTGARVLLAGARGTGIAAGDAATMVSLDDVVLGDVATADSSMTPASGLGVWDGASAVLSRVRLLRFAGDALLVGDGASATLQDALIEGGALGGGARAEAGSTLHLERVELRDLVGVGLFASDPETTIDVADVSVLGVAGEMAIGVLVRRGASVTGEALLVEDPGMAGIVVAERESGFDVSSVTSRASGSAGWAYLLAALSGGTVNVSGGLLAGGRGLSTGAFGVATTMTIADLTMGGTEEACATDATCFSTRLGAYEGARVEVTRFASDDGARVGAQVDGDSTMVLASGTLRATDVCAEIDSSHPPAEVLRDVLLEGCTLDVSAVSTATPPAPALP